mmetsp:Transcript_12537/g.50415  ORF Transcript_12537/g.50415 Transcript_12537/m.50415 type:complete len:365 (+) Transcript_12537:545-1639(+)
MTARSRAVCDVHHHSPPSAKGSLGASRAIAAESSRSASNALASVWGENGTPRFCALSTFRRSRAMRSLSLPPELPGVLPGVAETCKSPSHTSPSCTSPSASSSITAIRLGGAGVASSDAANVTRLAGVEPSSGGNGGGRPCTEDSTPARYDSSTSPERIPSALRRAASLAALASGSKESTAAPTTSSSASRATASIAATAASCAAVVSSPAASLSVLSPTSSSSEEKSSDEVYRSSSSSPSPFIARSAMPPRTASLLCSSFASAASASASFRSQSRSSPDRASLHRSTSVDSVATWSLAPPVRSITFKSARALCWNLPILALTIARFSHVCHDVATCFTASRSATCAAAYFCLRMFNAATLFQA